MIDHDLIYSDQFMNSQETNLLNTINIMSTNSFKTISQPTLQQFTAEIILISY